MGYAKFATWFSIFFITFPSIAKDFPQSPLSDWYKSLKQPLSGISCCDISDCGPADEFETKGESYRVKIENIWYDVPKEKIINNHGNPTGGPVVCYNKPAVAQGASVYIYCFVAGALL